MLLPIEPNDCLHTANSHPLLSTSTSSHPSNRPSTIGSTLRQAWRWSAIAASCLAGLSLSQAASVNLAWDPSTANDVTGYRVYYGTSSANLSSSMSVGSTTSATVPSLTDGTTYSFAVRAVSSSGMESPNSNLVAYTPSTTNSAPTIGTIANQTTAMNQTLGPISFSLSDKETPLSGLALSASSSNSTLIPSQNLSFGISGTSATLTAKPAANQTGSSTITLTVSDGTLKATTSFLLTVVSGNTTPTISNLPDLTIAPGSTIAPIAFTVGDAETAAGSLLISGTSSNSSLVPDGNMVFGGSGANRTLSVTPASGQTGSSTISVKVSDGTLSTSDSFVLTVGSNNTTAKCIWPTSPTPTLVDGGADSPVELGVKFKSDSAGIITGIRFYKASANSGTHIGSLWSSTGTPLASATFIGETASGWQQVKFSTPVAVAANTVYVASYHANTGHYSADANYFASTGADAPPLHALPNGTTGGNGVYRYGSTPVFPNQSWNNANYWVDVLFEASAPSLTISTASLAPATIGKPYAITLAATNGASPYNWAIASGTLPAGLTLNASTGVISGTPSALGTSSFGVVAKDSSSPIQTASKNFSLVVGSTQTALSIWSADSAPKLADGGTDNPVELGMKFRSDSAGFITGVRFYKAATNGGTHIGNLWSNSGAKLATATFSGETASGWQQVKFATPVAITANTVYVVSYHSTIGHYSADQGFFSTVGVDTPPLHALKNGVSGGNGVYAYGSTSIFPAQSWNSANYWVDVIFQNSL